MRIVSAVIGAFLGFALANGATGLLGILLGAFAGYAFVELITLRDRLADVEKRQDVLRKALAAQRTAAVNEAEADPKSGVPETTVSPPASAPRVPGVSASRSISGALASSEPAATAIASGWSRAADSSTHHVAANSPPQSVFDAVVKFLREYFTGGNTLVRVGIIILFFGVAFLLRYIAEHSRVPIQFRLSAVVLGGVVLLVLGWRLRKNRPGYALALQGGAVGIIYLTVFAALRLYALLSPGAAFALLVTIAAVSAALAVLQNSQAFALLGVVGGFLAPVLASTGQGSHVVLFTYYAVLNAGILAIAWFKPWRALNLVGFLFTFVVATAWGVLRYEPRLFASTEPFLILFFLFYIAIAILFAARQSAELRGYVDGTLVFGTPAAVFALQSGMVHQWPYALAYSAVVAAVLYLLIAWILRLKGQESQRLAAEAFLAIGILFLTLAVPLALDDRWSAATWALEGAALIWIGCRQGRRVARFFGALLHFAAGIIFWLDIDSPHGKVAFLNSTYLGGVMVSAASVFSVAVLQRYRDRLLQYESPIAPILFFWGLLWWLYSGLTEIQRRIPDRYDAAVSLVFIGATALICSELHQRSRLSVARLPALWLLPAMMLYALLAVAEVHHPSADGGWLAWPLAFGAFYFVCKRHEGAPGSVLANSLHVGSAWLLVALTSWEVAWAVDQAVTGTGSWPAIGWVLFPGTVLFVLPRLTARIVWPIGLHREAYVALAGAGLAAYLALWSLFTNFKLLADPAPFPFVPIVNPVDLTQAFVLLVLLKFWMHLREARYPVWAHVSDSVGFGLLAAFAFIWLNAALLRTLHFWAGVPLELRAATDSTVVQTSLTIFWTVLALATMLAATRKGTRIVWLTGAGLLAVVIAKLFTVDLSHSGTVERIVSFVGVGLLMLVIGYFSPLPPAAADSAS
jgi:uncharacterized membrane protein